MNTNAAHALGNAGRSEFDTPPELLIVHDPVDAGGFEAMAETLETSEVLKDFLFRDRPDIPAYARQHRAFVDLLRRHAPRVVHLSEILGDDERFAPARSNPNQVFTRDSVITIPWLPDGYIASRMKKPLRQTEVPAMQAALEKLGLREILRLPGHLVLEGGDVIPFSRAGRRTLLVGHGQRTQVETLYYLQEALVPEMADEIVGIELGEWRMNLDGGLVPVAGDVVVSDTRSIRSAFILDAHGRKDVDVFEMLGDLGMTVIDVTREESVFCQACNCVCLGGRRIVYYDLCKRVSSILQRHGVEVLHTQGSELVKGRGGPRCMTRPVYKGAGPPPVF